MGPEPGGVARARCGTRDIQANLFIAVPARFAAGALPEASWPIHLAARAWIAAFDGVALVYWPIRARSDLEGSAPLRGPPDQRPA